MDLIVASFVISLLSLGVSAAVAFGAAEQIRRWRIGPRLTVDFEGVDATSGRGGDSYYVRVPIANKAGRLGATRTEIYVDDIRVSAAQSRDPNKRAETIPGYVPMRFTWCHNVGVSQSIPSDERRLFDLCEIHRDPVSNAHKCLFRGEVVPKSGAYEVLLSGEIFEISLSISTESGKTVKQLILLKPSLGEELGARVTPL